MWCATIADTIRVLGKLNTLARFANPDARPIFRNTTELASANRLYAVLYSMANANTVSEQATLLAEIEADTYTDAQLDAVGKVADTFTYTSTLLTALADHMSGLGDMKAQLLLLQFAATMARHEAEVA